MAVDRQKLEVALNPRSIAVVGAKRSANYSWLRNMETFRGKVYSVQIDPDKIPRILELGTLNYSSVSEIPDEMGKPFLAILHAPNLYWDGRALDHLNRTLQEPDSPSFPSPDQAAPWPSARWWATTASARMSRQQTTQGSGPHLRPVLPAARRSA